MENQSKAGRDGLGPPGRRKDVPTAGGIYVALGLKNETVQVMRLSCRSEGTDLMELVNVAGPRKRTPSRSVRTGSGKAPLAGNREYPGELDSPDSPEERLYGETLARETEHDQDSDGYQQARPLPSDTAARGGVEEEKISSDSKLGSSRGGSRESSGEGLRDESRFSGQVYGEIPPSSNNWSGPGMVVALAANPSPACEIPAANVTPTSTPISRSRSGLGNPASIRSWGGVEASGAGSWIGGGGGGLGRRDGSGGFSGDEGGWDVREAQMFGLCSADGRVCCCRIVSAPGVPPRWQTVWGKQTEVRRIWVFEAT